MAAMVKASIEDVFKWNVLGRWRFSVLRVSRDTDVTGGFTAAAADEWISGRDLNMHYIRAAWIQPEGDTSATINVALNANGTGVAAGTNNGNLGVEMSSVGSTSTTKMVVFALGR